MAVNVFPIPRAAASFPGDGIDYTEKWVRVAAANTNYWIDTANLVDGAANVAGFYYIRFYSDTATTPTGTVWPSDANLTIGSSFTSIDRDTGSTGNFGELFLSLTATNVLLRMASTATGYFVIQKLNQKPGVFKVITTYTTSQTINLAGPSNAYLIGGGGGGAGNGGGFAGGGGSGYANVFIAPAGAWPLVVGAGGGGGGQDSPGANGGTSTFAGQSASGGFGGTTSKGGDGGSGAGFRDGSGGANGANGNPNSTGNGVGSNPGTGSGVVLPTAVVTVGTGGNGGRQGGGGGTYAGGGGSTVQLGGTTFGNGGGGGGIGGGGGSGCIGSGGSGANGGLVIFGG